MATAPIPRLPAARVRCNLMKTEQLFARYYSSRPDFVDGTTEFHRLLARFIAAGDRVLEIGPGPANATSAFLASRGAVVGVDVSKEVLGTSIWPRRECTMAGGSLSEDACFAACVSDYVLEHITDPEEHFREVGRVLRSGGVYCFRTPNLWHYLTVASKILPHGLHLRLASRLRGLGEDARDPHPTVYAANTRAGIRRLAAAAGLSITELRTIEKEPSYGRTNAALFFPMMAYERLVNSSPVFAGIRVNILCALQRPIC